MPTKRSGLGRNLSALLGSSALVSKSEPSQNALLLLPLSQLQPGKYQPRQTIEEASLQELAASIAQQGLLQPLIVRSVDTGGYEIIAGERRWRACQLAGLKEASVIIREVNDETAMAIALIENLQREDLNPIEQARAMAKLSEDFQLTHQQIADLVSKSRAAVTNQLRLLSLSKEVIVFLEKGDLDMGHARALLALEASQQIVLANHIIARGLSVRETEKLVKRTLKEPETEKFQIEIPLPVQNKIASLAQYLQAKIHIKPGKQGNGSLIIHYTALDELDLVIKKIMTVDIIS